MSLINWGDERFHLSDNSHNWIAPADIDQAVWNTMVRAHQQHHLRGDDIPRRSGRAWRVTPPNVGEYVP